MSGLSRAKAPVPHISDFFRRITGNARPTLLDHHIKRMSRRRLRTAMNCPTCNKDGTGNGEILRFVGRHGMVMFDRCPRCKGRGMIPMRALREYEGDTPEILRKEAAGAYCLECNNRRITIIPGSKSPTETMVIDACHVCCIPTILL